MDYTRDITDVIKAEEAYLRKHRAVNKMNTNDEDTSEPLKNKWGLSISGGGIRSATLGLGMFQKFMRDDVLKYFDYMSTVSGGGYIGSCVSSILSEPEKNNVKNARVVTEKNLDFQLGVGRHNSPFLSRGKYTKDQQHYTPKHQLYHLLTNGEYLTRNRSLFSLDIKRLVSAVLGGAISNILLLFLMVLMIVSGSLLIFQIIGGDPILEDSFNSIFDENDAINLAYLTEIAGDTFTTYAQLCFYVGLGFSAIYYWIAKSYILDKIKVATPDEQQNQFKWKRLKMVAHLKKWYEMNESETRAKLFRAITDLWNMLVYKAYQIAVIPVKKLKGKPKSTVFTSILTDVNKEDALVQKAVSRYAVWTIIISSVLISFIVLYQRLVYIDTEPSIKLILTLPIFFCFGALLFLFVLGLMPEEKSKYQRVVRSAYTGLYGGAFNAIVAAILIPFAIAGIFFFEWQEYGLDSPTTLLAPAATYILTVQSGLFKIDALKGVFDRVLPRVQRFLFNLSVFVFLFLIFQLTADFVMDKDYAIHESLRNNPFGGRDSTFLFWYGMGCSLFGFLFTKVRTWRFIFIYFLIAVVSNGLLVFINEQLDNYLMETIPLLVALLVLMISFLTGFFFTLRLWRLYNFMVLLVVYSLLGAMYLQIYTNDSEALKIEIDQFRDLQLTPMTFFVSSVLLTFTLGFFFIKRYRGTVLKFYQDRLTEAFLMTDGVVDTTPSADSAFLQKNKKRLRNHENLFLHQMGDNNFRAPYHILVGALNLKSKFVALRKDLKSEHFIFSKYFIGSESTGYVSSERYRDDEEKMTLSTAMSISAAAVNSAMGSVGFFAQTFFITLFNLRLGKWIKNPLCYADDRAFEAQSNRRVNGIGNLLNEYTGNFSTSKASINVSDGGHTGDNLGLLPLLKRRCSTIVVCDFEEDKNFTFGSLNTALRVAYLEEGIWIHIDLSDLMPKNKNSSITNKSVVVGTIYYPNEKRGKIIYIKSSLSGNLATNIWGYQRLNTDFPHQSTSDQYFDHAQYEAYRSLGYDLAEMAVDVIQLRKEVEDEHLIEPEDYLNYINDQNNMQNDVTINGIKQIKYVQLQQWQANHKAYELIDVREETEHEQFNIGGKNIPLSEVVTRHNEIDFSKPVVVYCKRGIRSVIAIQKLSQKIENLEIYNLNRGILDVKERYEQENDLK